MSQPDLPEIVIPQLERDGPAGAPPQGASAGAPAFLDATPPPTAAPETDPLGPGTFRFAPASFMTEMHFYPHPRYPAMLVKCQPAPPPGLPDAFLGVSIFNRTTGRWDDLWPLESTPMGSWVQLRDPAGMLLPLAIYRTPDDVFGKWL